jgi:hypothetical protein
MKYEIGINKTERELAPTVLIAGSFSSIIVFISFQFNLEIGRLQGCLKQQNVGDQTKSSSHVIFIKYFFVAIIFLYCFSYKKRWFTISKYSEVETPFLGRPI